MLRRRSSTPAASDGSDAKSVSLDVERELFVARPPSGSFGRIGDPGRRAHQHERGHELGPVQRELQTEASAHRVAHVGRPATFLTKCVRRRDEVEVVGEG